MIMYKFILEFLNFINPVGSFNDEILVYALYDFRNLFKKHKKEISLN